MSADAPHRQSDRQRVGADVNGPIPLQLRLDAVIGSVPHARHEMAGWLRKVRVRGDLYDDLALVITELVTNAVEASPGPNAAIEVRADIRNGDQVVLVVTDRGVGFDMTQDPGLPNDTAIRGRGLPIVNTLMDDLVVRRIDGVTEVITPRPPPARTHGGPGGGPPAAGPWAGAPRRPPPGATVPFGIRHLDASPGPSGCRSTRWTQLVQVYAEMTGRHT